MMAGHRRDPHAVGAGRRAARAWLDRRSGVQPAVDPDGHALRQRAGAHASDGLPLGVQIVGRFGRDRAALEAALFLERALQYRSRA